jgi:hypothetical protein
MPAFLALVLNRKALSVAAQALYDFVASRLGQIAIAFAVAWVWSGNRAEERCAAREAAARAQAAAAYAQEIAREQQAAQQIARAATERAASDALVARAMQAKIDAFAAKERKANESPVAPRPCLLDSDFARVVRDLDAAPNHPSKPSGRAR